MYTFQAKKGIKFGMKEENSLINDKSLEALNSLIDVIYSNNNKGNELDEKIKKEYYELLKASGKYTDDEISKLIKKISKGYDRDKNQKNVEELATHAKSLNDGEKYLLDNIKGEKNAR